MTYFINDGDRYESVGTLKMDEDNWWRAVNECQVCHALVIDPNRHIDWHVNIGSFDYE